MPQVHCYIPEDIAEKLRQKARRAGLPLSKYLATLVKQDVGSGWPEDFFDVFGSWKGGKLERPPQGEFEQWDPLA